MKNYTQLCYTALILAVFTACNLADSSLNCGADDLHYHGLGDRGRISEMRKMKTRKDVNPNAYCDNEAHRPMIVCAAMKGNSEVIKYLLEEDNADPNIQVPRYNGLTALMFAARKGNISSVEALLKGGALPDIQDNFGRTALTVAASEGFSNVVRALLKGDADPDLQTQKEKYTALIMAATLGHLNAVQELVKYANLDLQNSKGQTALFNAVYCGHVEIVRALVQAGANVYTPNYKGWAPFRIALEIGMKKGPKAEAAFEIMKILVEDGGLDVDTPC